MQKTLFALAIAGGVIGVLALSATAAKAEEPIGQSVLRADIPAAAMSEPQMEAVEAKGRRSYSRRSSRSRWTYSYSGSGATGTNGGSASVTGTGNVTGTPGMNAKGDDGGKLVTDPIHFSTADVIYN